jgi:hypothetical protein
MLTGLGCQPRHYRPVASNISSNIEPNFPTPGRLKSDCLGWESKPGERARDYPSTSSRSWLPSGGAMWRTLSGDRVMFQLSQFPNWLKHSKSQLQAYLSLWRAANIQINLKSRKQSGYRYHLAHNTEQHSFVPPVLCNRPGRLAQPDHD